MRETDRGSAPGSTKGRKKLPPFLFGHLVSDGRNRRTPPPVRYLDILKIPKIPSPINERVSVSGSGTGLMGLSGVSSSKGMGMGKGRTRGMVVVEGTAGGVSGGGASTTGGGTASDSTTGSLYAIIDSCL